MTHTLNGKGSNQLQLHEDERSKVSLAVRTSVTDDWSDLTKDLLDNLPQVWTRGLLYFLAAFVSIVLPWAMLSKVDETGKARGRLEPQGKTFRLDAAVAGAVTEIRVKEGDLVKAGQSLLVLESELINAQLQQSIKE
jgi:HlyD family secretion protein